MILPLPAAAYFGWRWTKQAIAVAIIFVAVQYYYHVRIFWVLAEKKTKRLYSSYSSSVVPIVPYTIIVDACTRLQKRSLE